MKRWINTERKSKQGQVALEYVLTTLVLALVASLLYVAYQPIVMSVLTPIPTPSTLVGGIQDPGIGLKQTLFLPVP